MITNVILSSSAQRTQWFQVGSPNSPRIHVAIRARIFFALPRVASTRCYDEFSSNSRFFSSRPALKKYIQANYKGVGTDRFDQLFNQALKKGAADGEFTFPKGMFFSSMYRL
jgi:hypothetical protein